ncbi:MAG: hypothetical protein V8R82_02075 [Clostridia bacterium]
MENLLLGILAGLAICTKQSIGVTLAFIVVMYPILLCENKGQIKQYFKFIVLRIIGIIIPVIALFIYLIVTNSLSDFINYAVLGIKTFTNKIDYATLLQSEKIEIRILSIAVPITLILMSIIIIVTKWIKKDDKKIDNILILLMYSLSIIIVMYPISDEIHFLIGSLISIISIFYTIFIIGEFLYNKTKVNKKNYKILSLSIGILLMILILNNSIKNIFTYVKEEKNQTISHYKNIEIEQYLVERIDEIDQFIKENEKDNKKIYVLDAEAPIYMIPINHYNKDYDMFLKGNIGKDGENGQIEKIKNRDLNTIYLIKDTKQRLNWQTPTKVIDYIRENLELIGEINIYEIYR